MDSRTSFFTNDIIHLELHDGFTSGGQLPKAWSSDSATLYKGEEIPGSTYCIYSEVICSDLAELLGIPHVTYWLEAHECIRGWQPDTQMEPLAACASFVDADHTAVTLYDVMLKNDCTQSQAVDFLCRKNVVFHCQMLLFDFIIANPDRHLRNLGFMKQGNQLEVLPLYDHDKALYSTRANHAGEPFSRVDVYERERLYSTYMLNLISVAKRLLPRAQLLSLCPWERLLFCDDIVNKYDKLPEQRRHSIIEMLKIRTQFMLKELQHD